MLVKIGARAELANVKISVILDHWFKNYFKKQGFKRFDANSKRFESNFPCKPILGVWVHAKFDSF